MHVYPHSSEARGAPPGAGAGGRPPTFWCGRKLRKASAFTCLDHVPSHSCLLVVAWKPAILSILRAKFGVTGVKRHSRCWKAGCYPRPTVARGCQPNGLWRRRPGARRGRAALRGGGSAAAARANRSPACGHCSAPMHQRPYRTYRRPAGEEAGKGGREHTRPAPMALDVG